MTSLVSKGPSRACKKQTVIGVYNPDDPQLQVEFDRARERLVRMHETRRYGVRKRVVHDAVQIVLVERLT